jgi:PTS system cellobiose-specific IIB component
MKILLVCAGGLSTAMMMEEMKKVIRGSKKLDIQDFPMEAVSVDRMKEVVDKYDIVLVGPQLKHKTDYIQKVAEPFGKAVMIIDPELYGAMDGASVLKQALIAYHKSQM